MCGINLLNLLNLQQKQKNKAKTEEKTKTSPNKSLLALRVI